MTKNCTSSILLFISLLLLAISPLQAQQTSSLKKDNSLVSASVSYGVQFPGADLSDYFGSSFEAGIQGDFITPSNWIIGSRIGFTWGSNINFDVLSSVRRADGFVISSNNSATDVSLRQRGIQGQIYGGKLFSLFDDLRSGIRLHLGLGYMQYRFRIQEDFQVAVPNVTGEYAKGYDQLTGGLALSQFVGYQHFSNDGLINFFAGVEFTQGFTSPLRTWDFATNTANTGNRLDLLTTLKLGWVIPFYLERNPDQIFY